MIHAISLAIALVAVAAMNLLIKAGARAIEAQQQTQASSSLLLTIKIALLNPWIIAGMICGILNLAAYAFALRKFPLSTAYPIMISMSYAIVVCGAMVCFSERPNAWQIAGMIVIMAGISLVAVGIGKTA